MCLDTNFPHQLILLSTILQTFPSGFRFYPGPRQTDRAGPSIVKWKGDGQCVLMAKEEWNQVEWPIDHPAKRQRLYK